jgi:hypothetical protein
MGRCTVHIVYDDEGTWSAMWNCGEQIFGVSDYDLARTRRLHECPQLTATAAADKVEA